MTDIESEVRRLVASVQTEPTPVAALAERWRRRRRRRRIGVTAVFAVAVSAAIIASAAPGSRSSTVVITSDPSAAATARAQLERVSLPDGARRVDQLPAAAAALAGWKSSCEAAGHASGYWLVRGTVGALSNLFDNQPVPGFSPRRRGPEHRRSPPGGTWAGYGDGAPPGRARR